MPVALSAFVLEYHPALRSFLASGLRSAGFHKVDTTSDHEAAQQAMANVYYDLVLFDTSRDLASITASIRTARQNLGSEDPFGFYLMSGPAPTGNGVERIVSCGCDAFLVRPFSNDIMQKRLRHLFKSKRSFVVTTHYVGPERRRALREETFTRRVNVPNVLTNKREGSFDPERHREAMSKALLTFNAFLVERQAYLVELLEEGGELGAEEKLIRSESDILVTVQKLATSLEESGRENLKPLVTAISETATQRIRRREHLGGQAARELQKLCGNLAHYIADED